MVVVVCGVSGAGKTVVGELLAQELGWPFYDADDFHSPANIAKMRNGSRLTNEDRRPWLARLRQRIESCLASRQNAVLACSALKKKYRDELRVGVEVHFVFLRGSAEIVAQQLSRRHDHFMDPKLLDSQFQDLEEPVRSENAIIIELGRTPVELVAEIKRRLKLNGGAEGNA